MLPAGVLKHALSCFNQAQPDYMGKLSEIGWLIRRETVGPTLHNCLVHAAHVTRGEYRQHVLGVEQDILGICWTVSGEFVDIGRIFNPSTLRVLADPALGPVQPINLLSRPPLAPLVLMSDGSSYLATKSAFLAAGYHITYHFACTCICHVSVILVLHQFIPLLIAANFFVDFGGCECPLGTTKKAAMECPSPPLL